MATLKA